jgi:hypothetical protein
MKQQQGIRERERARDTGDGDRERGGRSLEVEDEVPSVCSPPFGVACACPFVVPDSHLLGCIQPAIIWPMYRPSPWP